MNAAKVRAGMFTTSSASWQYGRNRPLAQRPRVCRVGRRFRPIRGSDRPLGRRDRRGRRGYRKSKASPACRIASARYGIPCGSPFGGPFRHGCAVPGESGFRPAWRCRYEVTRPLGSGTYGVVCAGIDRYTGQPVRAPSRTLQHSARPSEIEHAVRFAVTGRRGAAGGARSGVEVNTTCCTSDVSRLR